MKIFEEYGGGMERRRHRTAEGSVTQSPLPYETQSRFLASSFITRTGA